MFGFFNVLLLLFVLLVLFVFLHWGLMAPWSHFHTNCKNVYNAVPQKTVISFESSNHTFVEINHFFVHNIEMKHTLDLKSNKISNFHEIKWGWIFGFGQAHAVLFVSNNFCLNALAATAAILSLVKQNEAKQVVDIWSKITKSSWETLKLNSELYRSCAIKIII